MHTVEDMLVEKNYSKCPLKKRPVNYQFEAPQNHSNTPNEPQDLCVKKMEILEENPSEELINVSDCCEDEGVDVDHTDDEHIEEEDEDIDVDVDSDPNQTQAAALAAAAAVAAAAAASVVVPTPTYPKYPWNFHMSPYTAEFYRTINQSGHQISPLRSDLIAPSSPSDSLGSLSPPPHHYLHGRASSVSPPMRSEIIHRPIGVRQHRFLPYPAMGGNQVKKSFSCKDCDKTYVSLGALKMHIRTHTLPCKCNLCGKAFSRPWLLQGHIRTHTGEKPFSCQHCHRAFADRSNLRAHLQTHSDIKKYSCTSCSKTFSRMSLLTKHSESGCPGGSAGSSSSSELNYAGYAEP
ncbi:GM16048 [Drosophila sechellia]|uniref:GM16048 n=1 Tax=Drosophila sechellia TaxID=7238 RepID=B4HXP5_DROSE|nr:GM16048 [Drosophila sechellia]